MNKSPRQMKARFDGKCSTCSRKVYAGEPIKWFNDGINCIIECSDCNEIKKPISDTSPQASPQKSDVWAKAFTWEENAPKKVSAKQIRDITNKPDSQCQQVKGAPKPIAPKPAPKPIQPAQESAQPSQPILPKKTTRTAVASHDALSQTAIDLLVTLINTADRLSADQCAAVREFAFHQKHHSASEKRRILFSHAARALGQIG